MPRLTTADDTTLYYKDWNGGGRAVVLIHGWPLNADSWDRIGFALAQAGHRVIAYDRRGFGRSDQPWTGYDYDTLADDLRDVLTKTGVQDAAIVGFSMGGGEVARYMSRHNGQGVRSAALISSVVPYMLKTDDNPDGVPQSTFAAMTKGMLEDRAHFMKGFLKDFFGQGVILNSVSDELLHWAWGMCMQAGLRPTLACAEAFGTTDFRPDLPAFTVPTLVIHGTKDQTVPIDAAGRAAAKRISGAQLIEYDGEPHGLIATATDRLIDDLKQFLMQ